MLGNLLVLAAAIVGSRAAWIDHISRRLPNRLTGVIAVMHVIAIASWWQAGQRPSSSVWIWIAISLFHMALVLLPTQPLGAGDWKLISAISLVAVWWGIWWQWLELAYVGGALAGIWALRRGLGRTLAFGTWLIAAWWVVLVGQFARVALAYCR